MKSNCRMVDDDLEETRSMFWIPDIVENPASPGPDPGHFLPPITRSPSPRLEVKQRRGPRAVSFDGQCRCREDREEGRRCRRCSVTARTEEIRTRSGTSSDRCLLKKRRTKLPQLPSAELFKTKTIVISGIEHTIQIPLTAEYGMALFRKLYNNQPIQVTSSRASPRVSTSPRIQTARIESRASEADDESRNSETDSRGTDCDSLIDTDFSSWASISLPGEDITESDYEFDCNLPDIY